MSSSLVYQYGTLFDTAKKPSNQTASSYRKQYPTYDAASYLTPKPTLSDNLASLRDDVARLSGKSETTTPLTRERPTNTFKTPNRSKESLYYEDYSDAQARLNASTPFLKSVQKARAGIATPDRRHIFNNSNRTTRSSVSPDDEWTPSLSQRQRFSPSVDELTPPTTQSQREYRPFSQNDEEEELALTQSQIKQIYRQMVQEPPRVSEDRQSRWRVSSPVPAAVPTTPLSPRGTVSLDDVQSQLTYVTEAIQKLQLQRTQDTSKLSKSSKKRQDKQALIVGQGINTAQKHLKQAIELSEGLEYKAKSRHAKHKLPKASSRSTRPRDPLATVADADDDEDDDNLDKTAPSEYLFREDAAKRAQQQPEEMESDDEDGTHVSPPSSVENQPRSIASRSRTKREKAHRHRDGAATIPQPPAAYYPAHLPQAAVTQQQYPVPNMAAVPFAQSPVASTAYPGVVYAASAPPGPGIPQNSYYSTFPAQSVQPAPSQQQQVGPPQPPQQAQQSQQAQQPKQETVDSGIAFADMAIDNNILKRHLDEERQRNEQMISKVEQAMQRADAQTQELRRQQQLWEDKEASWRSAIAEKEQALHILRLSLAKREAEWAQNQLTAGDRVVDEGTRKSLEAEVKALNDYSTSLSQQLAQARLALSNSEKQSQTTTEELARLSALKNAAQSEMNKLTEESMALQRQMRDLSEKNKELNETTDKLRREIRNYQQEKQENDIFFNELKTKLRETQQELGSLRSERDSLTRSEQVLKDKCSQLEGLIVEIRTKLVVSEEQLQEERRLRKLTELKASEDVGSISSRYDAKIQLIEEERNSLEMTVNRNRRELAEVEEKLKSREMEVLKLKQDLMLKDGVQHSMLAEMRKKEDEYQDAANDLRRKSKELQDRMIEADGRVQALQQRLEEAQVERNAYVKAQEERYRREIDALRQDRENERQMWQEEQYKSETYFTNLLTEYKQQHNLEMHEAEVKWQQRTQEALEQLRVESRQRQDAALEKLRQDYEAREAKIKQIKEQEYDAAVRKMEKDTLARLEKMTQKYEQEKQNILNQTASQMHDLHTRAAAETSQLHQLLQSKDAELDAMSSKMHNFAQEQRQARVVEQALKRAEERIQELENALENATRRQYQSEQQALSPIRSNRVITLGMGARAAEASTPESAQPSPRAQIASPDLLGQFDADLERLLGYESPEREDMDAVAHRRSLEEKRRKANEVLRSLDEEMTKTVGRQGLMGEIDACARNIEFLTPKKSRGMN